MRKFNRLLSTAVAVMMLGNSLSGNVLAADTDAGYGSTVIAAEEEPGTGWTSETADVEEPETEETTKTSQVLPTAADEKEQPEEETVQEPSSEEVPAEEEDAIEDTEQDHGPVEENADLEQPSETAIEDAAAEEPVLELSCDNADIRKAQKDAGEEQDPYVMVSVTGQDGSEGFPEEAYAEVRLLGDEDLQDMMDLAKEAMPEYDITSLLPLEIGLYLSEDDVRDPINDNSYEPDTPVTTRVYLEDTDFIDGKFLFHYTDNSEWEQLDYVIYEGTDETLPYAEFVTDSFSPFIFADMKEKVEEQPEDISDETREKDTDTKTVQTEETVIKKQVLNSIAVPSKTYTVTYKANGGQFDNGKDTNTVTYETPESTISKTNNVSEDGEKTGAYGNNLSSTDTVTIEGAEKLNVEITYQTQSTYYDWVCVYDGSVTPSATNYNSSVSKKLGGTTKQTKTYTVNGDTVKFYFKSNAGSNDYYGYYAVITPSGAEDSVIDGEYKLPEKEGDMFLSWNTKEDGSGNKIDAENIKPKDDTTLYAQYYEKYTVTYKANGGTFKNGTDTNTVVYGKTADGGQDVIISGEYMIPEKEGDRFMKWTAGNDGTEPYEYGEGYSGKTDVTLTAKYYDKYIVTYDANGGSFAGDKTENTVTYGISEGESKDDVIVTGEYKEPEKEGHKLIGWNTKSDFTGKNYNGSTFPDRKDTKLYARFEKEDNWIFDYVYELDESEKKIILHRYIGTKTDVVVPPEASINGISYSVIMDQGVYHETNIERIKIEEGVKGSNSISGLFSGCTKLVYADIEKMDTSDTEGMTAMFNGCSNLEEAVVKSLNTSNVKDMSAMFSQCGKLQMPDVYSWDVSGVLWMNSMFQGCSQFKNVDLSTWDTNGLESAGGMFYGCSDLETLDVSGWDLSHMNQNALSGLFGALRGGKLKKLYANDIKLPPYSSFEGFNFGGFAGLEELQLRNWNIKNIESLSQFFASMQDLRSLDLRGWDTGSVDNMSYMFVSDNNLEEIKGIGRFDTSSLTRATGMFNGCEKIESLPIENWNLHWLKDAQNMFYNCKSLAGMDMRKWNLSSIENMSNMFDGCENIKQILVGKHESYDLKRIESAFYNCREIKSLDLSGLKTNQLTSAGGIVYGCNSLDYLNIDGWDFRRFSNNDFSSFFSSIRYGASTLEILKAADIKLSYRITSVKGLLGHMSSIRYIDVSGWEGTHYIKDAQEMFVSDPILETIDMTGWDTSRTTTMRQMFANDRALKEIIGIEAFDVSNVSSMEQMFSLCNSLKSLDLGEWKASNLLNLESLDLSGFNTQNVYSMANVFSGCIRMRRVNLSGWDSSHVSGMEHFMNGCQNLEEIVLGNGFAFVGKESNSFPYKKWVNIDTDAVVEDLWEQYDGQTMAGTYRRYDLVKLSELNKETVDGIDFDAEKKKITVYIDPEIYRQPTNIFFPELLDTIKIDDRLVSENEELSALLSEAENDPTITDGLQLSIISNVYADVVACSTAQNIIWTFNVPKGNEQKMRIDIYSDKLDEEGNISEYIGWIENNSEEKDVFILYDAEGNVTDTLEPNERHTYGSIGITDHMFSDAVYPEYSEYITYDPGMNNYEVPMQPGRYRFSLSTEALSDIDLVYTETESADDDHPDVSYVFEAENDSEDFFMTLFNKIKKDAETVTNYGHDGETRMRKVDAVTGKGVAGATYRFTGIGTGDVVYGITDAWGYIRKHSLIMDGVGSYTPPMLETYVGQEVKSPSGYYLNDETFSIMFQKERIENKEEEKEVLTYADGISIQKDEFIKSSEKKICYTCETEHGECICHDFGRCNCHCCGVSSRNTSAGDDVVETRDYPWPSVSVRKNDGSGTRLAGVKMQLIDKGSNVVLDEWTTGEEDHSYQFNTEGHAELPFGSSKEVILREISPINEYYTMADDVEFVVSSTSGTIQKTMVNPLETVDISVEKSWNVTGDSVKKPVHVQLYRRTVSAADKDSGTYGERTPVGDPIEITADDEWTYTFEDQFKNMNGWPIIYSVEEIDSTGFITSTTSKTDSESGDMTFTISNTSTKVTVDKKNSDGGLIAGAHLQVKDSTGKVLHEWDTDGTSHLIEGILDPGTYTLHETKAPEGYETAEDMTFTLNADGTVTVNGKATEKVEMTDAYTLCSLKVKKAVAGNMGDRHKDFDFTLTLKDKNNTPYTKAVTVTKDGETKSVTPDAEGKIAFKLAHGEEAVFGNIIYGTKYEVAEADYSADGYTTTAKNASGTVAKTNPDAVFTNSRGATIPTGIKYSFPWAAGIVLIAGTAYIIIKRRRKA